MTTMTTQTTTDRIQLQQRRQVSIHAPDGLSARLTDGRTSRREAHRASAAATYELAILSGRSSYYKRIDASVTRSWRRPTEWTEWCRCCGVGAIRTGERATARRRELQSTLMYDARIMADKDSSKSRSNLVLWSVRYRHLFQDSTRRLRERGAPRVTRRRRLGARLTARPALTQLAVSVGGRSFDRHDGSDGDDGRRS